MRSRLLELARESLGWIGRRARGCDAEIYLARGEDRGIELRNGALESLQSVQSEGAGLRVLDGGRMGFSSAGGLDLKTVQDLFGTVSEQMPHLEPDSMSSFPAAGRDGRDEALEASLWDDSLFKDSLADWQSRLEEAQARALAADPRIRSVLRIGYGESRGEVAIANTRGVEARERGSSATVGFSALAAGKDGELQVGAAFQSARRRDSLDFDRVIREGVERATALLDARRIRGGRRAVIVDPWVAGEFLEIVTELLCADAVQRGRSLLAGKVGSRVGSELVTLIDDPRRPAGAASSLYDDEGCPTSAKTMVEKGLLREFFYDAYTAAKDGRPTNASASRGSYRGIPGPAPSNFYLAAGAAPRERLLSDTLKGLLVLDVLGMHMTDPVSGEVSVGVSGVAVEDGRLTHAVKGCMISGNILSLLGRIDMVADDLAFHGSMGAPTFRIADVMVA